MKIHLNWKLVEGLETFDWKKLSPLKLIEFRFHCLTSHWVKIHAWPFPAFSPSLLWSFSTKYLTLVCFTRYKAKKFSGISFLKSRKCVHTYLQGTFSDIFGRKIPFHPVVATLKSWGKVQESTKWLGNFLSVQQNKASNIFFFSNTQKKQKCFK